MLVHARRRHGRVVRQRERRSTALDWTPLWLKELTVRGKLCYGSHAHAGASRGAFEEAANVLATSGAPLAALVTHTFKLSDYARAIATASDRGGSQSVKVAFRF